jgi:serine/threonine protein phosphatase PrpC
VASLAAARAARDVLAHRAAGIEGPGARPAPVSAPAPAPAVGPYPAGAAPVVDPNELTRDPEDAEAGRRAWLPVPEPTFSSGGRAEVLATWLTEATHAANLEVIASAGDPPRANPPSCTFVGAILEGTNLAVGWVGDSRAYWVPDDGEPEQLTVDDSWAAEQIALGATREEAENSPQAHAITRWLGVDAPHPAPRVTVRSADRPGWLLVCSDGLWNYASAPEDVRALLSGTVAATGPDPAAVTASLVGWAIARGGHDNISVALARVGGTGQ